MKYWIAIWTLCALTSCKETDKGTETDSSDTDTDTDSDPVEIPYSTYSGWEGFRYFYNAKEPLEAGEFETGTLSCSLLWTMEGTPWADIQDCEDCEFVFDIAATFDAAGSTDDGTCDKLNTDYAYTYGYVDDYYGYGSYLMYYSSYYGNFSAWTGADFDGAEFTYYYGIEDYDIYGDGTYYYTLVWEGAAAIE